jgi:Tfp pilus assembly protein PilO
MEEWDDFVQFVYDILFCALLIVGLCFAFQNQSDYEKAEAAHAQK